MCAGGLAEQGDVGRIPAETRDVGLDPTQGGELILQAVIARRTFLIERRMSEEAEHPEPIVEADDDDALAGERRTVELPAGAGTELEAAAVDPDHHRLLPSRGRGSSPDVESEAILAMRRARLAIGVPCRQASLAERRSVANSGPVGYGLWRPPAIGADGRRCIGHAPECGHAPRVARSGAHDSRRDANFRAETSRPGLHSAAWASRQQ